MPNAKPPVPSPARIRLLQRLGHDFNDESLLDLALTHRSCGKQNNERLEFLGDSILGFVIGQKLFDILPDATEGQLSRVRSALVKGETLAAIAREFNLGESLKLGEGEMKSGGFRRDSILADAVEAIIGAVYEDAGFENAKACVLDWFESRLQPADLMETDKDPKTALQELLQARKLALPVYEVVSVAGEHHQQSFVVECRLSLLAEPVKAEASSRRKAEKAAAAAALAIIKEQQI
ncbi:ribonuclease III [Pseudoteredinibacter isoporae]|uniref:Ribonuclease 3 n=1 Tax=Pseudoteredinibacter isoporae TaxID=570281 RepID=A0A7X0MZ27_9GAMM|nr:ribonuclease-3 [Pseudoteredinibacter isoporae]